MPLNIEEEQFEAYKHSIQRARWFNMINVLLSSLIIFHLCLEQLGYSKFQLQEALLKRAEKDSPILYWDTAKQMERFLYKLKELEGEKDPNNPKKTEEIAEKQKGVAQRAQEYLGVQNVFYKLGQPRTLPLLGLEVPANDYFPLMAVMLTILAIALWLNVRSVWASVKCLLQRPNSDELKTLIRLHFTFTSLQDQPIIVKIVQIAAIWLPFLVVLFGTLIDMIPVIQELQKPLDERGSLGPWGWRLGFLVLLEFVLLAASMASTFLTRHIDRDIG